MCRFYRSLVFDLQGWFFDSWFGFGVSGFHPDHFIFLGSHVPERRMEALAVVVDLNELEDFQLHLFPGRA